MGLMPKQPPRIIVLEGTDATGKSEIAQVIHDRFDHDVIHAGPPEGRSWWAEYLGTLAPYFGPTGSRRGVVLDRWHLGEWVWPDYFGRPSLFRTRDEVKLCHQTLASLGARTFVLDRPALGIIGTLIERGETAEAIGRALAARLSYQALSTELAPLYGVTWTSLSEMYEEIEAWT